MSSFWSGYSGIALVLDQEEFDYMSESYKKKAVLLAAETERDYILHPEKHIMELEEYRYRYSSDLARNDQQRHFQIVELSPDHTDGRRFCPFCKHGDPFSQDVKETMNREDTLYVIFSNHQVVRPYGAMPYQSYLELENEFREKLAGYLPGNFNWEIHIGEICYAAYA